MSGKGLYIKKKSFHIVQAALMKNQKNDEIYNDKQGIF